MATLEGPVELLELKDGESRTFTVERWEQGELMIRPAHRPDGKVVPQLRLHVSTADKPTFPHYWDVTATTLVAQLRPWLQRPDRARWRITVKAQGVGEKKRFSVETRPA